MSLKETGIPENKWGKGLKLNSPSGKNWKKITTSFDTVNHSLLGNISRKYQVLSKMKSSKIITVPMIIE